MTDDPRASLHRLTRRLETVLSEPVDFTKTDTATTLAKVQLLTAAATYFNILAVADFGGPSSVVRAEGLVEHAVGAAFQTFAGADPHPGHFEKAAMLLRGITRGHPFNDGNKRVGFLLAGYYLRLVGYRWPAQLPEQDVISFIVRVSAGDVRHIDEIAEQLRHFWAHVGAT